MSPLDSLLQDPHVAESFKRQFLTPSVFLEQRHLKAQRRRFYEQPECVTGFNLTEPLLEFALCEASGSRSVL